MPPKCVPAFCHEENHRNELSRHRNAMLSDQAASNIANTAEMQRATNVTDYFSPPPSIR